MTEEPSSQIRPSIFLSYVHKDNDYHDGMLIEFAQEVKEACEYKGIPIALFIDKNDIQWGEEWKNRLHQEITQTTFLLAMITNRYVASETCCEEFIAFRTKTKAAGYDGLLTLLVDEPDWNRPDLLNNPTAQQIRDTIKQHQWLTPGTPFESLEPNSRELKKAARNVATELMKRINSREAAALTTPISDPIETPLPPGIIETIDDIESLRLPALEKSANSFRDAMNNFNINMNKEFALIPQGKAPNRTQITRIAQGLEPSRLDLDAATASFSKEWQLLDGSISDLTAAAGSAGLENLSEELLNALKDLGNSSDIPDVDNFAEQVKALPLLSRELRPVAETLTRALSAINAIKQSAAAWADEL